MSVEDAFDHLETAEALDDEAEQHRDRARKKIREAVEERLDAEASVDVDLFDEKTATVKITPTSLVDFGSELQQEGEQLMSITPSIVRISSPEAELNLDFTEEALTSKTQRDRIKHLKDLITALSDHYDDEPGAPVDAIFHHSSLIGMDPDKAEQEVESLRQKGEVYEPQNGYIRTT